MKYSKKAVELIKKWEGKYLTSYLCPANVWTIGWGSIMYKDGSKVRRGQIITDAVAEDLLLWEIEKKTKQLNMMDLEVNQNQFDAIVSFTYNVGIGAFRRSTLLRLIKTDPNDLIIISAEFLKWNKIRKNGRLVVSNGLNNRRKDEIELYCEPS